MSSDPLIACAQWDTWAESVFYQDEEGAIREWRYTNNKWGRTSFKQTDCKVGTNIAAVFSPGAERVMLFFQDLQGHISYRYVIRARFL